MMNDDAKFLLYSQADDGSEQCFLVDDVFDFEGNDYAVLFSYDEELGGIIDDGEFFIYRVIEKGSEEAQLEDLEPELLERVLDYYKSQNN